MSESGTKKSAPSERTKKSSLLNIPNQLTMARLILSVVFFVVLALFDYEYFGPANHTLTLNLVTLGFVLAVSTDFLDGYLARRWKLVSTFGRIADPFVDKIIICGSFIMLIEVSDYIRPWFAVVILFREFLVSGLRSYLESKGIAFGASLSGKLKMVFQSTAIPLVIFYEANFAEPATSSLRDITWLRETTGYLTLTLLALTLATTLLSCVGYLMRAVRALEHEPPK